MWQDIVIGLCNVVFMLSVLPSIFSNNKPAILTSITTAITLLILSVTQYTLDLYFGSITLFISSILWLVLFLQTIKTEKNSVEIQAFDLINTIKNTEISDN